MGGARCGLANQLARIWVLRRRTSTVSAGFWKAPRIATHEGLKAVQLFEATRAARFKALVVIGTNPAVSLPDAHRRAALKKLELFDLGECALQRTPSMPARMCCYRASWAKNPAP